MCSSGSAQTYIGFDANVYPGDDALPALHRHFAYIGYWLNTPPGDQYNTWRGKRSVIQQAGFGYLVLFNGHFEKEFIAAADGKKNYASAAKTMGLHDAKIAIERAKAEGFPAGTIIFLDIEEGGSMLPGQAAYLFAWSEAVSHSEFKSGAYCSGQPVDDGGGVMITTADDIRTQAAAKHLHPIALWIAQDACPPAPGCVMSPPPLGHAGVSNIEVWQYAQSPRRKSITKACGQTYSANNLCLLPELPQVELDLNAAESPDPSHGR
jgi:hypothetical protein